MLYQMAMLLMTLVTHNPSNHPFLAFFVAFHSFVVGQLRGFKFGTQVGRS